MSGRFSVNLRRRAIPLGALFLITPGHAWADAYDGVEPPPVRAKAAPVGYHFEYHPRWDQMIAGGVLLGVFYGVAAAGGIASKCSNSRWLLLPIAGPFAAIPNRASVPDGCDDPEGITTPAYALDGLAQILAATLLAGGVVFPKEEIVRDRPAPLSDALDSLRVRPVFQGKSAGIDLSVSF